MLRSNFIFFLKDCLFLIKSNKVYLNGCNNNNINFLVTVGDCIQLDISKKFFIYFKFLKKLLKKKVALHKYNSWKFFKKKSLSKIKKFTKRKIPKYLYLFFLFKLNTPKIFEIDYITISLFLLTKEFGYNYHNYFEEKLFSFKFFKLYNYKKIN